ncbi:hypothetical protein [Hymenobacter crusticola]|uniref:Uncharacterized protein n=1 Tax=Hymenobacter crusticola TaxID=1770526 RepID=A0A243W7M2_9BACT|nr:hypothetical protein [Hymenobacter crusticola]OUJ68178.1 hypothetical protein BXP70_28120 [Hymenobacter crusticola]
MSSLTKSQAQKILAQYAGTTAQWTVAVWLEEHEEASWHPQRAILPWTQHYALVVYQGKDEVERWLLRPATYQSLLAQLETGATNPYAIAPIPGFIYDDPAQVYWARERTQALYRDVVPLLSRLHQLRYHLDDTPGIPLSAALAWWKQADSLIAQFPTYQIQAKDGRVGRPQYQVHSSFMLEELRLAELEIPKLQRFLLEVPYPTSLPKFVFKQRLSSRDYPALFDTPVQEVVAKPGEKLTTGSGDRYPERRIYTSWSFDHAFSLARTSEPFLGSGLSEADLIPANEPNMHESACDVRAQLLDIQARITKLLEAFPQRD